mmetsp:Transcript_17982/g.37164  ORF Transcript_17982/g.37164 Transcript_17982/m.37164 type:complete len:334 (+) Transcript_17982:186-1187(+)
MKPHGKVVFIPLLLVVLLARIQMAFSFVVAPARHQQHHSHLLSPPTKQFANDDNHNDDDLTHDDLNDDDDDDLTKEELVLRFRDVLKHYQDDNPAAVVNCDNKDKHVELERIRRNLIATRLSDLHLNRCFVAPSSIPGAGLGVFANRRILVGELLTLFPGDALLLWNGSVGDVGAGLGVVLGSNNSNGNNKNVDDAAAAQQYSSDKARLYELKIGDKRSIVGNAQQTAEPAYIGHLINDGCTLTNRSNAARTRYSRESAACCNAVFEDIHQGCHYMVVASKEIQTGEELFASYGEGYWMSRIEAQEEDKDKRSTTPDKNKKKMKQKGRGFSRT